ncbi:MAG: LAGLIDADG family homing endonuclease, partial [Candidatus Limnocylindria bacterium]
MARSSAPTKPANGTTNGNGNGHENGNGSKTKPSGYVQLTEGQKPTWKGLSIERRFTRPDVHPYDTVEWDLREAAITNEHGKTVFEQKDLEFPKSWSALATNVVASKYFRGHLGTPERERSVRQMIDRVADTIADWGIKDAYFATTDDAEAFRNELKDILLKQRAAFNSPVWFNVGIDEHPQCSACQPYHALVSTPEGMTPIGRLVDDVAVGREVYDANGVTRIVAVKNNGRKPVWRIRLANGNFVEATPDHVVKAVHERRTTPVWLRVDQLEVGMRMHLHPHRARVATPAKVPVAVGASAGDLTDAGSLAGESTEEDSAQAAIMRAEAALAGWLQADGFVGQYTAGTNRSLTIEFQVANDDEYAWVMQNLDVALPLVHFKVRDADTKVAKVQRIRIYGEVVRDFVERWGLLRRGTDIRVPERLFTASYDEVCTYLRSIFQADGYVTVDRARGQESGRVAFAVIGERWAEDVQLLLNSIGIYSRRSRKQEKRADRHDLHEVVIAVGSERARFTELVGFVGRDKQARLLDSLSLRDLKTVPNVREERIVAIDELGVQEVYDIQTESGEYLSNNVAVHNCFINSVDDTMESILGLAKTEGMLFKFGSGAGSNLSTIRSSKETLRGGGEASGPVSFMKGFDAFAGVIKSGGKTRRAAKMVILNADHPDVEEFIDCKLNEERKAWALIDAGYDGNFNGGEAYASVFFQNSNNSVRVTDDFMDAVEKDKDWTTHAITTGEPVETVKARYLMNKMAEAAWVCGDPGIQYHDNINRWHTSANTAPINASNPCVTGDTLVATDEGWRRIDSLVGKKANVIGADGQPHPVDRIFPTGTKLVLELKTRAGYRVKITADHLVSTQRGDVAVKDLTTDDKIFLNAPGFGRKELSAQLAEAIGLAVGDGYVAKQVIDGREFRSVILTMHANEAGVLEMVAKEVNEQKAMLRAVGSSGRPDNVHYSVSSTGARLAFASRPVVDQFLKYAVLDEGADAKRFTDEALSLDRWSQAALIRGLFTADGTVNGSGTNAYVALDSASHELLVQVQRMLLGFGIKAKIYENRRGGKLTSVLPDGKGGMKEYAVKEMHSLRISRASRIRFEKEIGFSAESPKIQALARVNATVRTYSDELVDEFASATPLGEAAVFDLTESATTHFVANGFVIHNCSEYMYLDDSACNLASLNLMTFVKDDGEFDVEAYKHAVRIVFTAQEIIVDNASYPTPQIGENSRDFRPIGLGYANLGALLMNRGLAYDSDGGRSYAAVLTSIMQSEAALQSARIARDQGGPFAGYKVNREPYLKVMNQHRDAAYRMDRAPIPTDLLDAALTGWDEVVALGEKSGFRNGQLSVLAPTGTIAFLMDCDTTGVEPDIALIKYKRLVGGGYLKIVNQGVPAALKKLGYDAKQAEEIVAWIDEHETIEGAPHISDAHLEVFDCAFKPANGTRSIHYNGHLKMMAAVQPFISGAISKTVN